MSSCGKRNSRDKHGQSIQRKNVLREKNATEWSITNPRNEQRRWTRDGMEKSVKKKKKWNSI